MTDLLRPTPGFIAEVCRSAAGLGDPPEVLIDPLDASFWVRLQSADAGERAVRALAGSGVSASTGSPGRVHAAGWDARLLRRRLGVALAGVDDLMAEWTRPRSWPATTGTGGSRWPGGRSRGRCWPMSSG